MTVTVEPVPDLRGGDAPAEDDLDEEIRAAEEALAEAEVAERVALNGDEEAHHRASDHRRWCRAATDRLTTLRAAREAASAEQRRRQTIADAEALLVGHHLDDVINAYVAARRSLDDLVNACEARRVALVEAGRLLRTTGVEVGSPSRPRLVLSGEVHRAGDSVAGQLVAELVLAVAKQHKLTTSGGTRVDAVLARGMASTRGLVSSQVSAA